MNDPVAVHVATLERALHGPSRLRRSMVAEVRGGLEDAADHYQRDGADRHAAAAAAVRDFGPVGEIAPLLQHELAVSQARRTCTLLAFAFPSMLLVWDLLVASAAAGTATASAATRVLARAMDAQSILVGLFAVVLLLATFRPSPALGRLPVLVALTGLVGVVGCAVISVLMMLVNPPAPIAPYLLLAYALSLAVLVGLGWACLRTLQVVRLH